MSGADAAEQRLPVDFFLTESLLTEEERAVRDRVRVFAETELRPIAGPAWEDAEFPATLIPKLAALDILGGSAQGYGCPGMSSIAYGLALQELSRVDSSFATFYTVHTGLAVAAIARCGSDEQQAQWLPRLACGEAVGAFALTEPEHGSDASHLETRAVRDGDGYVLDGAKRWIGNATICDVAVVWARDEEGIAGFLVSPPVPGYEATAIVGKLAQRSGIQTEIRLAGCHVPAENRMPRTGFRAVAEVLSASRYGVAWHALGEAIACYEIRPRHQVVDTGGQ